MSTGTRATQLVADRCARPAGSAPWAAFGHDWRPGKDGGPRESPGPIEAEISRTRSFGQDRPASSS
eukprot:2045350-Pyramimonas_sp.AAC.1